MRQTGSSAPTDRGSLATSLCLWLLLQGQPRKQRRGDSRLSKAGLSPGVTCSICKISSLALPLCNSCMEGASPDPPELFVGENSGVFFPKSSGLSGFLSSILPNGKPRPRACGVYINERGRVSSGRSLAEEETSAPPLFSPTVFEEVRGQAFAQSPTWGPTEVRLS